MTPSTTLVAEGVLMVTAPNPGPKTLEGTNTYVVGRQEMVVIDPGPDIPEHVHELARFLRDRGRVRAIVLTHTHPDHAGGAALLGSLVEAPIYVGDAATTSMVEELVGGVELLQPGQTLTLEPDGKPQGPRPPWSAAPDLQPSRLLDDRTLTVIASPGHSVDHVVLMLNPERMLFSGDTILGRGTTLIALPEGDMIAYMDTLKRLRDLKPTMIAPGHGPVIGDPIAKIDEYIAHRREREDQLIQALSAGPATLSDLTDTVYGELSDDVMELARLSVGAQLGKLQAEKQVSKRDGVYRLVASS